MEQRQGNIIIHASGGTSGKGAQTYKLALPSSWAKQIGITGQERSVELSFDGTAITIRKRLNMDELLTQKHAEGHTLLKLSYYNGDTLCTTILADPNDQTLCFENYTDRVLKTAFGNNHAPTWADFQFFLAERCIPRTRGGLREYLETIGVEEYDPLEIIRKTEGRMAEDQQWIRVEVLK